MKSWMKLSLLALLLPGVLFANVNDYSKDRIIVKLKKGSSLPSLDLIDGSKNLFGQVFVVKTSNVEKLREVLNQNTEVEYTELDYIGTKDKLANKVQTEALPPVIFDAVFNDSYIGRQWTFNDSESNGISVSRAYRTRRTSPREKIIVAVVDTGVDYNHNDLPMWENAGEIPGNGIDDDGNGYIDDIYGINTLVRDSNGDATMDMRDTHSHGTHVSGSIAAIQNNNRGIAGIASNAEIMGIRTVPNRSDEKDVDVIEAFVYAAKNGAKIINCSFGKDHNEGGQAVSEAIEFIGKEYGVLVVAAAGNSSRNIDSRPTYPASFTNDNLLVVASTTRYGSMSYFSNYGSTGVDLAAPGSSIYSTTPNNRYSSMSGTSMASPNTAGVAAEVLSHFPELTPSELKDVLMRSVVKVSSFSGKIVSGGRVDLEQALQLAAQLAD